MMNSRIEMQMNKTVIVIGPDVTISLVGDNPTALPPLSFESAKQFLRGGDGTTIRDGRRSLLEACTANIHQSSSNARNVVVRLQELQHQGALLAYLYPDNVLDTVMKQEPLTAGLVDKWLSSRNGIMHIFGSCNDVESMQCLENARPCIPDSILDVFSNKACVCIGFESDVQSDLEIFLDQLLPRTTNVLVAYENDFPDRSLGMGLPVAVKSTSKALCSIGDTSQALGGMIEHFTNELGRPVSFLMASKADYMNTAVLLKNLPGMNFQLMNSIEYNNLTFHVLTAQVDSKQFSEFWQAVMCPNVIETLVKSTVLAIILDECTFVWLNGEKTAIPTTHSSIQDLKCSVSSSSSSTQEPATLSFGISSVLKQKTLPRYTIRKQKIDSKYTPSDPIFRRRMSLPHSNSFTMAAAAASANSTVTKGKQSPALAVSSSTGNLSKQQLLLTRYLHNQRKNETILSTAEKEDCKTLRRLLQEKKTDYPKPSYKATRFLSEWITGKRKALFISENHEWSNYINDNLVKKMAKWRRIREKRLTYLKKRQAEEEHKVRRSSLDSTASTSSSDSLRHHLSAAPGYAAPLQSPLLATVNPYLLSQPTGNASFTAAGIRTAATATPMLYQSPYLSSYPLLAPAVPLPYLLPGTSNLVLVSSGNSNSIVSGGPLPTTVSTSVRQHHATTGPVTLSSTPAASSSFISPPSFTGSSPITLADVKPKRKRLHPEKSVSTISSLLMSKELAPSASKQSRMISSPASVSDDKSSDGEESNSSDHISSSPETEDSSLSLWKFLLELLLSNSYSSVINWSRIHVLEFHIKQPQEVAKLWSNYKSDSSIDCTRFKKALRYYCTKEQPVLLRSQGGDNVYQFSPSMLYYINNRYSQFQRNMSPSTISSSTLERPQDMCGSQEVLVVD